jgi:hypothetical protein
MRDRDDDDGYNGRRRARGFGNDSGCVVQKGRTKLCGGEQGK